MSEGIFTLIPPLKNMRNYYLQLFYVNSWGLWFQTFFRGCEQSENTFWDWATFNMSRIWTQDYLVIEASGGHLSICNSRYDLNW